MRHLDIIYNDWNAGVQRHVGTVVEFEGHLMLKDAAVHEAAIRSAIQNYQHSGGDLLAGFACCFQGSRIYAIGPHAVAKCPVAAGAEVPMESGDLADLLV